jgi:hypothetical protein
VWYKTLSDFLKSIGFAPLDADSSVFRHENGTIMAIYVDELLIAGPNKKHIKEIKEK